MKIRVTVDFEVEQEVSLETLQKELGNLQSSTISKVSVIKVEALPDSNSNTMR